MGLSTYDYNQINEILKNFVNKLNEKNLSRREVTIPLSEYESIKKNENLYFKKVTLLEEITQECELVLKMDSEDWDNETLYKRIYKIYEKIIKDW